MAIKYFFIMCFFIPFIQAISSSPEYIFKDVKVQEWFSDSGESRSQGETGLRVGSQQTFNPTTAAAKQFPYQVAVEAGGSLCGGSIYNTTFVITSARCVYGLVGKDVLVYANSTYIPFANATQEDGKFGIVVNVKYVYVHENYVLINSSSGSIPVNDIALLELVQPLTLKKGSGVDSVPLTKKKNTNIICTVTGWEFGKDNNVSSELQYVSVNITKFSESPIVIGSGAICIGVEYNNVDIAEGDPGGPLVCNGYLTGILSSKSGCNSSNYYSYVWTDVSYYNSWITDGHPEPNKGHDGGASSSSYSSILVTFLVGLIYFYSLFTKNM